MVGEIKRYFRDRTWVLRVPRAAQELGLHLRQHEEILSMQLGRLPSAAELAATIGISEAEVIEAQTVVAVGLGTVSLSDFRENEDDGSPLPYSEHVGISDVLLDNLPNRLTLIDALERLEPRLREILWLRFFADMTQSEIGDRMELSQMHISRLEEKALKQLRALLPNDDPDYLSRDSIDPRSLIPTTPREHLAQLRALLEQLDLRVHEERVERSQRRVAAHQRDLATLQECKRFAIRALEEFLFAPFAAEVAAFARRVEIQRAKVMAAYGRSLSKQRELSAAAKKIPRLRAEVEQMIKEAEHWV
jgi:RNA polymerase sigma factor (sigma-70 family)